MCIRDRFCTHTGNDIILTCPINCIRIVSVCLYICIRISQISFAISSPIFWFCSRYRFSAWNRDNSCVINCYPIGCTVFSVTYRNIFFFLFRSVRNCTILDIFPQAPQSFFTPVPAHNTARLSSCTMFSFWRFCRNTTYTVYLIWYNIIIFATNSDESKWYPINLLIKHSTFWLQHITAESQKSILSISRKQDVHWRIIPTLQRLCWHFKAILGHYAFHNFWKSCSPTEKYQMTMLRQANL